MTVRLRLALVVFLTGLATALGVIVTVVVAFERFEHESTWQRGDAFVAARIENVMAYEKWKAGLKGGDLLRDVAAALGKMRYG